MIANYLHKNQAFRTFLQLAAVCCCSPFRTHETEKKTRKQMKKKNKNKNSMHQFTCYPILRLRIQQGQAEFGSIPKLVFILCFAGHARCLCFNRTSFLRKGYINPRSMVQMDNLKTLVKCGTGLRNTTHAICISEATLPGEN